MTLNLSMTSQREELKPRITVFSKAGEKLGIGGDLDRLTDTGAFQSGPANITENTTTMINSTDRIGTRSGFDYVIKFIIMWTHCTSPFNIDLP